MNLICLWVFGLTMICFWCFWSCCCLETETFPATWIWIPIREVDLSGQCLLNGHGWKKLIKTVSLIFAAHAKIKSIVKFILSFKLSAYPLQVTLYSGAYRPQVLFPKNSQPVIVLWFTLYCVICVHQEITLKKKPYEL